MALPIRIKESCFLRRELIRLGADKGIADCLLFAEHHQSHAASAFFPSPFDDAVVLTMDGVGEWATTSVRPWFDARNTSLRAADSRPADRREGRRQLPHPISSTSTTAPGMTRTRGTTVCCRRSRRALGAPSS